MKKLIPFLFLYLGVIITLSAQVTFRSEINFGSSLDNASCINKTSDNGYILCGSTNSIGAGDNDGFVLKLDALSNLLWSTTIGGSNTDQLTSIIQNTDGDYIAVGYTSSYGAGGDIYIAKLNNSGNVLWAKTIGSISGDESGYDIIQVADGGYIICGKYYSSANTSVLLVKVDASGTFVWAETMSNLGTESVAQSIVKTADGGFAIAGYTGANNPNIYIAKFNSLGALLWTRSIAGANYEVATKIIETNDGGLAVVGSTTSYGAGNYDVYFVKLDNTGLVEWTRTIGTTDSETANSLIQSNDGGYIIIGGKGIGLSCHAYLAKISVSGAIQWSYVSSANDWANSITLNSDGGYTVLGGKYNSISISSSDIFVAKYDSLINTCNSNLVNLTSTIYSGGVYSTAGTVSTLTLTNGIGGITGTNGSINVLCLSTGAGIVDNTNDNNINIYPNPSSGKFTFNFTKENIYTIEIYNSLGDKIYTSNFVTGKAEINLGQQSKGIYFYRIISEDEALRTGRIILE